MQRSINLFCRDRYSDVRWRHGLIMKHYHQQPYAQHWSEYRKCFHTCKNVLVNRTSYTIVLYASQLLYTFLLCWYMQVLFITHSTSNLRVYNINVSKRFSPAWRRSSTVYLPDFSRAVDRRWQEPAVNKARAPPWTCWWSDRPIAGLEFIDKQ
jgi:hypothetical protein